MPAWSTDLIIPGTPSLPRPPFPVCPLLFSSAGSLIRINRSTPEQKRVQRQACNARPCQTNELPVVTDLRPSISGFLQLIRRGLHPGSEVKGKGYFPTSASSHPCPDMKASWRQPLETGMGCREHWKSRGPAESPGKGERELATRAECP